MDGLTGNILVIRSWHITTLCNCVFIEMQNQRGSCIFQYSTFFKNKPHNTMQNYVDLGSKSEIIVFFFKWR